MLLTIPPLQTTVPHNCPKPVPTSVSKLPNKCPNKAVFTYEVRQDTIFKIFTRNKMAFSLREITGSPDSESPATVPTTTHCPDRRPNYCPGHCPDRRPDYCPDHYTLSRPLSRPTSQPLSRLLHTVLTTDRCPDHCPCHLHCCPLLVVAPFFMFSPHTNSRGISYPECTAAFNRFFCVNKCQVFD